MELEDRSDARTDRGRRDEMVNAVLAHCAIPIKHIRPAIQDFVGQRTLVENLEFFTEAETTVGPVYDAAGFELDPHVRERGVLVEMKDRDLGV